MSLTERSSSMNTPKKTKESPKNLICYPGLIQINTIMSNVQQNKDLYDSCNSQMSHPMGASSPTYHSPTLAPMAAPNADNLTPLPPEDMSIAGDYHENISMGAPYQ